MTLEEAIKHCEEVAEEQEYHVRMKGKVNASECYECAKEHRQLAEWLTELKELRSTRPHGEWIEHTKDGITHIECSECKSWFLRSHLIRNSFCPSCGADMQEVKE